MNNELNQELVKKLFDYKEDETSSYLIWKISNSNRIKIGKIAGPFHKSSGYYRVEIDSKKYYLHRIIFLWHHGFLPKYVDHIDKNKLNNKISNLRETTSQNNNRNRSQYKNTSSGIKGISWHKSKFKWEAQIRIDNKLYHLGRYDKFEDAVLARYKKECELSWNVIEDSPAYQYLKEKGLI